MGVWLAGYGFIALAVFMFGMWACSDRFTLEVPMDGLARGAVVALLWPVTVPLIMVGLL